MRSWWLLTLVLLLAGCGEDEMPMQMIPEVMEVEPAEGPWDVTRADDENPDPAIVEVTIEAAVTEVEYLPGRRAEVYAYNGTVPGPLIEARVGDRVVVHFRNSLPEPTTIHWHGLRLPAAMDGVAAIVPAGGTFDYELEALDPGLFWYHPHVRSEEQVERGLYAPLLVRGPDEPDLGPERIVVLDDVLVNDDGTLAPFEVDQAMPGRQGNLILVNGRARPIAELRAGERQRWRIVNAANARYFRLALPEHTLALLGGDQGFFAAPREVSELLLVPGDRADVVVIGTGAPGAELDVVSLQYDRGHGTGELPDANVLHVRYAPDAPIETPPLPAALGSVDPIDVASATMTRPMRLAESAGGGGGHAGHGGGAGPTFSINGETFPTITPLAATMGDVEVWEIVNTTEMDHPFHLHGFRFQVEGAELAWEDTVNVPAGATTRFAVRFEGFPGEWMFHCHILEHAERGMMGRIDVAAP
jgi:FtsP/CotA-like multicopper oxidase with cupredoxin domain